MKIVIPQPKQKCSLSSSRNERLLSKCSKESLYEGTIHKVETGDTLSGMAKKYYGTKYDPYWCYILEKNGLDTDKLSPDTTLTIPPEPHPNDLPAPDCKDKYQKK